MPIEIEKFFFIFFNIGTYFKIIANGDFFQNMLLASENLLKNVRKWFLR